MGLASLEYRDWTDSMRKALSIFDEKPESLEIKEIEFAFEAPSQGRFRGYAIVDGQKIHLCDISDIYPPFANIKAWLETMTEFNSANRLNTAVLTLDCAGSVISVMAYHIGWHQDKQYGNRRSHTPVSLFIVHRSGRHAAELCCFCDTKRTIKNMYQALMSALADYSSAFDRKDTWHSTGIGHQTSSRLRQQLFSRKIELL